MTRRLRWFGLAAVLSCAAPMSSAPTAVIPPQPPPPAAGDSAGKRATHAVRGKLLAHDGSPLEMAHVSVVGEDGKPGDAKPVSPDGSFVLPLEDRPPRVVRVQVTGVDHRVDRLVIATDELPVEVTIRMGTYRVPVPPEKPTLMLFLEPGGMRPYALTEQANGTYFAELALSDGKYGYEIQGLSAEGHVVNGTSGEGFEYDDDGDYKNTFTVTGGKARIEFDPKKRPPSGRPLGLAFARPGSISEGLSDIHRRTQDAQLASDLARRVLDDKGADAAWAPVRRELVEIARTHKQPLVRLAAEVASFSGTPIAKPTEEERARARGCVEKLAPLDPLWSIWPSIGNVVAAAGDDAKGDAYTAAFVERHPDVKAASEVLIERLRTMRDPARAKPLYVTLLSPRFDGLPAQREAKIFWDPDRTTAPGRDIGAFEVHAITGDKLDPRKTYTPKTFAGKPFLVDVWATWCKPCVAEMPRLHEIHAKYGKRIAMLSVSLDPRPEDVVKFRQDKEHPMPWLQAFVGRDEEALKTLVGTSSPAIPLYMLVDEHGKIIAASPQLSGQALPAILDRVLR